MNSMIIIFKIVKNMSFIGGETQKKLEEIHNKKIPTQEERECNEYEEKLAQSHKTIHEISKLKDDIDNLASSLKVPLLKTNIYN